MYLVIFSTVFLQGDTTIKDLYCTKSCEKKPETKELKKQKIDIVFPQLFPQPYLINDQYVVGSIRLELRNDDDYDLKTIQPLKSTYCIIIKLAHSYAQTAHLINKNRTTYHTNQQFIILVITKTRNILEVSNYSIKYHFHFRFCNCTEFDITQLIQKRLVEVLIQLKLEIFISYPMILKIIRRVKLFSLMLPFPLFSRFIVLYGASLVCF